MAEELGHTLKLAANRRGKTLVSILFSGAFVTCVRLLSQDTIELLQARVSALDSATLDQVEARLQVPNP